ncbi:MAG: hypothetical protein ACRBB0_27130 [Pelagimonas sp.]|uniref:hypothetical protein n=1 Tax=Pelagimonas sp. TaxID=2073170 RepID=UPI003D6A7134
MASSKILAERALVSTCVHLVLAGLGTPNDQMWLDTLRDLLPECKNCPLSMAKLRHAATQLCQASDQSKRSLAMARLRMEVSQYCADAAGARCGAWQEASASSVVDVTA